MAQKPTTPKGTRDFSTVEMARRNYIFDTIREVFRLFGFRQIETPAMENLSTLMGKYGEEGDKLLLTVKLLVDRVPSIMYCQVLRVLESGEEGAPFEYGCQFLELNEADQDKITENIFAAQLKNRGTN